MLQLNDVIHGFRLDLKTEIDEISANAYTFVHEVTRASLIALAVEDDNKVFMASFKTPPADHTGVAHILEHSVLNGSAAYPVKEPFSELLKGSLNTFLNAMTYPDRTVYPVSSRNVQDFANLTDVYLDAIFRPLLSRTTFQQEGWHYHLEDKSKPVSYSGIVYNEMLGAYSDPEQLFSDRLDRVLFPDNVYGKDSGGDPDRIPELTYEGFRDFYQSYYHPSNCLFFIYGDLDISSQLERIQGYLSAYEYQEPAPMVEPQPRFHKPVEHTVSYPITGDEGSEKKTYAACASIVGKTVDAETHLAMTMLARILSGTSASPLHKALIDSRLGEDTFFSGYDGDILDGYYSVGLKGTEPAQVPAMIELIERTLQELVTDGIDPRMIESTVNSIEFDLREANFGSYPKGIVYGLTILTPWLYGRDTFSQLRYETTLAAIKEKIAAGGYFEEMIERLLLRNPHRVTLTMIPDTEQEGTRLQRVAAELADHKAKLSESEIDALVADTQALRAAQLEPDTPEALATIPKLPIDCVDRAEEELSFEIVEAGAATLSFSEQPTNGIAYVQLSFAAESLPQRYLAYLPLFSRILLQAGTTKRDYVELTQEIGIQTGGIGCGYSSGLRQPDRETIQSKIGLSSKVLNGKVPQLHELLAEVIADCDLRNVERIRELITMMRANLQAQVIPGGHRLAARRLAAYHSRVGHYQEITGGLSQFHFLEQLEKRMTESPEAVLADLETIRDQVFSRNGLHVHVTGNRAELDSVQAAMPVVMDVLNDRNDDPETYVFEPMQRNEGLIIPSKIQYVGKGANLYELGYDYHGSYEVLDTLLGREYLWNTVRVQGNAYGAFVSFAVLSGNFCCLSYRDPKLSETLATYDAIPDYVRSLQLSRSDFERFVIGTIGGMDSPRTPDQKGAIALHNYLSNIPHAQIQQRREEILDATLEQMHDHVDILREFTAKGSICVVGGEEALRASAEHFDVVQPVFG
jgi:Zn-dependent M16 (insulinase) family peptidase